MRPFILLALTAITTFALAPTTAMAEPVESSTEFSGHGYSVARTENEYKLFVPKDKTEEVWAFLNREYAKDAVFLRSLGPGYGAKFADEQFVDRYFDTPKLDMLHRKSGVRHRSRTVTSDPTNRKNGRQLVQVKLNGAVESLNRAEIKYPVRQIQTVETPDDQHPLIGLVEKDSRSDLKAKLNEIGLDPYSFRPTITLEQRRRRVYISYEGKPYATITLDEVTANKWLRSVAFTEIEMELNEIGYTEATAEERLKMEKVNAGLKSHLLKTFPEIHQDQSPKYNKAYKALEPKMLGFPIALSIGFPLEGFVALGGFVAMGGIATLFFRRRNTAV